MEDNGDNIRIAISSEAPYPRNYLNGHEKAYEILGHKEGEVEMTYFTDGAPLALNHNLDDQVGALKNVTLDKDGVIRADVIFSKSQRGQEIKQDVVDGIRSRVSVGYEILEMADDGEAEDGTPIVRATLWRPYEASIVPVPADITVGVGKNLTPKGEPQMSLTKATVAKLQAFLRELDEGAVEEATEEIVEAAEALLEAVSELSDEVINGEVEVTDEEDEARPGHYDDEKMDEEDEARPGHYDEEKTKTQAKKSRNSKGVSMKNANGSNGAKETAQLARIANEYGKTTDLPSWIESGRSVSSVMEEILDSRSNAHRATVSGLSRKEDKDLSFARSIEGLLSGDNSLANEMGRDAAERAGIATKSNAIYIPLNSPVFKGKRTMTTGNSSEIVANEYLTLEDALREQSILGTLGVQVQQVNNVLYMPRLDGLEAAFIAENDAPTPATSSFTTIEWKPNTLALDVPYTRQLKALDGTYDVEEIVRQDILGAMLEGMEKAVFAGSGSNQPVGLEFDELIPFFAANTGSIDYQSFVQLARLQRENKGSATNHFYVLTPGLYEAATITPRFASTAGPGILNDGTINGVPVLQSNFLSSTSSSGKAIYGNFQKTLVAHFGVLEIMANPYRQSNNRRVTLEGTLFMDSHIRQPKDLVVHRGLKTD